MWLNIAKLHENNELKRDEVGYSNLFDFIPPSTPVQLNVGGDVFTTTCRVLTEDKYSILAALCRRNPPVEPFYVKEEEILSESFDNGDEIRSFFLDRDGQLFHIIFRFLETGDLPRDIQLLKLLYTEAFFYRLHSLQKKIEHLLQRLDRQEKEERRKRGTTSFY